MSNGKLASPIVAAGKSFLTIGMMLTMPLPRKFELRFDLCVFMCSTVKSVDSKSTGDFEGPFKPAKTLKQGSVLDLLKAPG